MPPALAIAKRRHVFLDRGSYSVARRKHAHRHLATGRRPRGRRSDAARDDERLLGVPEPGGADDAVRDRYDPNKATVAACEHLSDLHDMFGDWELALAAYNWGPTNVNKAILTPPTGKKAAGQRRARAYAAKVGGRE